MDTRRRASRPYCPHSGKLAHPSVCGSSEPVTCPHCHRYMMLVDAGRRFPRHRFPSPRRVTSSLIGLAVAVGLLVAGCAPPPDSGGPSSTTAPACGVVGCQRDHDCATHVPWGPCPLAVTPRSATR